MQKKDNFLNHINLKKIILILILFCFSNIIFSKEINFGKEKYLSLNNNKIFTQMQNGFNGIVNVRNRGGKEELNYFTVSKRKNEYSIYGTKKSNILKCKLKGKCFAYGYKGADMFLLSHNANSKSGNIYAEDFAESNEGDFILINIIGDSIEKKQIKQEGEYVSISIPFAVKFGTGYVYSQRKIFIKGVSKATVEEWVDIATGEYRKTEKGRNITDEYWKLLQKENPIKIE